MAERVGSVLRHDTRVTRQFVERPPNNPSQQTARLGFLGRRHSNRGIYHWLVAFWLRVCRGSCGFWCSRNTCSLFDYGNDRSPQLSIKPLPGVNVPVGSN